MVLRQGFGFGFCNNYGIGWLFLDYFALSAFALGQVLLFNDLLDLFEHFKNMILHFLPHNWILPVAVVWSEDLEV